MGVKEPQPLPPKTLCFHCQLPLYRHSVFGRCPGGKTQFFPLRPTPPPAPPPKSKQCG